MDEKVVSVLCVDDDPTMRDIVDLSLGLDSTIRLVAFANGTDALEFAVSTPTLFDIVLLDLYLPDMSGAALMSKLANIPSTTGATGLLLTAAVSDAEQAWPGGAGSVIAKPFNPLTLSSILRQKRTAALALQ